MKSTTAQTEFDTDGELNNFTFQYPNILLCNYQGHTLSKMNSINFRKIDYHTKVIMKNLVVSLRKHIQD